MANVLDDIATRFMAFSDALEASFGDLSIDFSLPSKTAGSSRAAAGKGGAAGMPAAGDAGALAAAAAERAAAKQRGEEILAQLPPGYFDTAFDPLEHELRCMAADARQGDIDNVVDRLTAAMEVVGVRLAKHVLRNQDKLIAGITNVTLVEDDLKAAYATCQSTRAQLRAASHEVQQQIKIITCTRTKQRCLQLYGTLSKFKQVQDLPAALRHAHEADDYAEAVLLCMDGFRVVEQLGQFKVAPALQLAVQRAYYDATQRMASALQQVCADFSGHGYSRLLEAYLLQGLSGEGLADKVLSCFRGLLQDVATRLVRSMVLARLAFQQGSDGSSGSSGNHDGRASHSGGNSSDAGYNVVLEECSFADLCRRVAPDMLWQCLSKLLEASYDLLLSYVAMEEWQAAGLAQHNQAAAAAGAAAALAAAQQDGQPGASDHDQAAADTQAAGSQQQQQLVQVQAATKSMLSAVHTALVSARGSFAEAAAVMVKDLLVGAGGCSGTDFAKVVQGCLRFAALAEAFSGGPLPMRSAYVHVLSAFVKASHKSNMQALKQALATEMWAASPSGSDSAGCGSIAQRLAAASSTSSSTSSSSSSSLAAYGEPGFMSDMEAWAQLGNPFRGRGSGRAAGGQRQVDASTGVPVEGSSVAALASDAAAAAAEHSGSPQAPTVRTTTSPPARSALLLLRWLCDYAGLMPLLPAAQPALWGAMAELFDNFLLACFILFGSTSLQDLAWRDGCLPTRLRNALLRITTSAGCKYKAEMEELVRTKPAPEVSAGASAGGASGAAAGARKLDAFTRMFKDTVVDLINTDLSQPLPEGAGTPRHATPGQQPSSQPPSKQSPKPRTALQHPQQQSQQQPQQQDAARPSSSSGQGAGAGAAVPTGPAQPATSAPPATGLRQRVVAIASLSVLADALRAARALLQQRLGGVGLSKEVEAFFSRTVDAAADLQDAIYMGGAKQLMPVLADREGGVAADIAACNYGMREPATRYQPWVEVVVGAFGGFSAALTASQLPQDVQLKLWDAGVRLAAEALLDGIGTVRRCTQEGRASMSLDLSAMERRLRTLAPAPSALSSLRLVDTYIKAFYIPWEELGRWAQTHIAEYGKGRILVLVEAMADAYGVRRGARAALVEHINTQLSEFA